AISVRGRTKPYVRCAPRWGAASESSLLEGPHRLANRLGRPLECGSLLGGKLDLDDLLEPLAAELTRHPEEETLHAVLALQPGGAGEDTLLVLDDRLRHLHGARGGRVVGGAGLEVLHDLGPPIPGALDDLLQLLPRDQLGYRNPGDGRVR